MRRHARSTQPPRIRVLSLDSLLLALLPWLVLTAACTARGASEFDDLSHPPEVFFFDASPDLSAGQDEAPAATCAERVERVELSAWVTAQVAALPNADSNAYLAPTGLERQEFKEAVLALAQERCQAARALARQAGFRLVELRDGASSVFYLEPQDRVRQAWGLYLVRAHEQWSGEVVFEAPHPLFDEGTGVLAALAFERLGGAALAIAGTHRCANIDYAHVDGRTRVCNEGRRGRYRESDMAHAGHSCFQAFHEAFADAFPESLAIQFHAFVQGDDDPLFIVSDGTHLDAGAVHPSNRLHKELLKTLAGHEDEPLGASCNLAGHPDSLCATTNVQGRYSNGVAAHRLASRAAAQTTGRFVHVELSSAVRFTDDTLDGEAVIEALSEAFF